MIKPAGVDLIVLVLVSVSYEYMEWVALCFEVRGVLGLKLENTVLTVQIASGEESQVQDLTSSELIQDAFEYNDTHTRHLLEGSRRKSTIRVLRCTYYEQALHTRATFGQCKLNDMD